MKNTAREVYCFYKWCFARKTRYFLIYFVALCVWCFALKAFANNPCELIRARGQPVPTYYFKEDKVDSDCDVNIDGRLWTREEQDISINSIRAKSIDNAGKLRVNKINVYNSAADGGASTWTCIQNIGEIEAESIRAECVTGLKHGTYWFLGTMWAITNAGTIKATKVFGKADGAGIISFRLTKDEMKREMKDRRESELRDGIYKLDEKALRKAPKKWGFKRNVREDIAEGDGTYEVDWMMGVGEIGFGVDVYGGRIKAKTVIGISKKREGIRILQVHGGSIEAEKIKKSLTQSWYPDQDGKHIPIVPKGKKRSHDVGQSGR